MEKYMLAIDIGGTFTDVVAFDIETGDLHIAKIPSTPKNFALGVIDGAKELAKEHGVDLSKTIMLTHGTTIATNAIIQRQGAKTGMITTKGFKDLLEIGRKYRGTSLYDLFYQATEPLAPRNLVMEVPERLLYDGSILEPLNEEESRRVIRKLKEARVESIAVNLIFSYLNPVHEQRVEDLVKEEFPEAYVSLSSEINPQHREYERACTTVMNVYVMPTMHSYISHLEKSLKEIGIRENLYLMQSSGGVMSSKIAKIKPVHVIESGPTAGALAAAYIGKYAGFDDIISFDMGGTTAKVCLVENGEPSLATEYNLAGYSVRVSALDLVEVGSGGGSIAWVDSGGMLHVGPMSAGAEPGPACYGFGGIDATVTDANLYLRRLNPDYFLGGAMKVYPELAEKALKEKIAKLIKMDLADSAYGILEIACLNMLDATRLITVERGLDPRDFVLVAFGGAGPLHAVRIADELGISKVVVPPSPGIHSAWGLLTTDMVYSYVDTHITPTRELDFKKVEEVYRGLENKGRLALKEEGIRDEDMRFLRFVDVRYIGQWFEITVSVLEGSINAENLPNLIQRFHELHDKRYAWKSTEAPTEIVNLRINAVGLLPKIEMKHAEKPTKRLDEAFKGQRKVYFLEHKDFVECPIYERRLLPIDCELEGPAVIEQMDSTTLLPPEKTAYKDKFDNVIVKVR